MIPFHDKFRPASIDSDISDLIKKAVDIVKSNTTHRDTLAKMIETQHELFIKEKEILTQQDQMTKMEKRIENLEKLLAENKDGQRKSA